MLPILPPFSLAVKNISEFFKIFRKFFQVAFKDFQISPTKKGGSIIFVVGKSPIDIMEPIFV